MVQFGRIVLDRLNSHTVSRLRAAKGLSRAAARCFAALSMTELDLSVDEELSRSFEPCLKFIIGCGRDTKVWLSVGFGEARFTDYPKAWPHPTESLTRMTRRSSSALMAGSSIFCQFPVPTRQRST